MYGHAEEWRPAVSRLVQWVKRGWTGAPAVPIATRDVSARIGGVVRQVLVRKDLVAEVSLKSGEPPATSGPFDLASAHTFHEELAASKRHSLSAARARLSRARRLLQEAEMELRSARLERRYAEVRAPISARVVACKAVAGQFVQLDEPLLLLKAS